MDKMYKVLAFWTGIFAVMFYLGDMDKVSLLFVANTGFFLLLGFLNLTERMYMYIFWSLFDGFLRRFYLLDNIFTRTWCTLEVLLVEMINHKEKASTITQWTPFLFFIQVSTVDTV